MIKHQDIKQRFGIIGNSNKLDRAINTTIQIAPTDISVLITGESGVGKESMPKIIHYKSQRKHINILLLTVVQFSTIDSELFGHKKGAFLEQVIIDKVILKSQMAAQYSWMKSANCRTQVRLLRVLESGKFMKVGQVRSKK